MPLVLTPLKGIPLIRQGDNLADVIVAALSANGLTVQEDDILVLAQKIVSKAEGRMVNLASIAPGEAARSLAREIGKDPRVMELVLRESRSIVRKRPGTVIVEHNLGFICANAGIDHSNVAGNGNNEEECVLLLPVDPDGSAAALRRDLSQRLNRRLGIMIIDSHGRAWRIGTVGACIGLSGIPAVIDERGWSDLFGYTLRITVVGVADELAAAASLMMGQAAEGTPIVHVRGFPYPLGEGSLQELIRPRDEDLFR